MLPPVLGDDERPVDVAIICAGNYGYATGYPTALLRALKPKHVIVGHWEDVFRPPLPVYQAIRLTDTYRLAARIREYQQSAWVTPEPERQSSTGSSLASAAATRNRREPRGAPNRVRSATAWVAR